MKSMRVRAVADTLVVNIGAMDAGIRRHVGRKFDPSQEPGKQFPSTGEAEEVPVDSFYVSLVQSGELEAADAETAKLCDVPFKAAAQPEAPKKGS